jgi:hypothetical protein
LEIFSNYLFRCSRLGISGAAAKGRGNISASLARTIADPRSVRIERILKSNVLDMKLERATLLNLPPSSKYDLYLTEIRKPDSNIKQIGVPNDLEFREVEINTDDISLSHKEVQCFYGDDTDFYNALNSIVDRKKKAKPSNSKRDAKQEKQEISSDMSNQYSSSSSSSSAVAGHNTPSTNLSDFIKRSSYIMETILSEQEALKSKGEVPKASKSQRMLSEKLSWLEIGKSTKFGENELIREREVISIQTSSLQPSIFVCVHPYPLGDQAENDLRPFKVLFFHHYFILFFMSINFLML